MLRSLGLQTKVIHHVKSTRHYALCGPPQDQEDVCGCPPLVPGGGRRIIPPAECRPGPIPYNPCCPSFHHGVDTYKKYKYIFFFVMLPLIICQYIRTCGHEEPAKKPCRQYEYMRKRAKKFPWGDGDKTFFHNDHVNSVSSECVTDMKPDYCD